MAQIESDVRKLKYNSQYKLISRFRASCFMCQETVKCDSSVN